MIFALHHFLHFTSILNRTNTPFVSLNPSNLSEPVRPYGLDYGSGATLAFARLPAAPNTTTTSTSINGTSTSKVVSFAITSVISPVHSQPAQNRPPCNGHTEFCNRRFSNLSMVVAHNSPFVVLHNVASNQDVHVLTQLNDGIRGCKTYFDDSVIGLTLFQCSSQPADQSQPRLCTFATHPATSSMQAPSRNTSGKWQCGSKRTRTK